MCFIPEFKRVAALNHSLQMQHRGDAEYPKLYKEPPCTSHATFCTLLALEIVFFLDLEFLSSFFLSFFTYFFPSGLSFTHLVIDRVASNCLAT